MQLSKKRFLGILSAAMFAMLPAVSGAAEISGDYIETRTCDIYTGPCFANAEVGLTGSQALLAWSIDEGSYNGVELSGLNVMMAVRASDTLGFGGGVSVNPYPIRSIVIVDEKATPSQEEALVAFAKHHAAKVAGDVVTVHRAPIAIDVDHIDMVGSIKSKGFVNMKTRKLTRGDCICTNETVYYPPLAKVDNAAPAYTVANKVSARGLGATWDTPSTRSSFLATFAY